MVEEWNVLTGPAGWPTQILLSSYVMDITGPGGAWIFPGKEDGGCVGTDFPHIYLLKRGRGVEGTTLSTQTFSSPSGQCDDWLVISLLSA